MVTEEKLYYEPTNGYDRLNDEQEAGMQRYCEQYKAFLGNKTERLCVKRSIELAEERGFRPYQSGQKLSAGDKVYFANRGKGVLLAVIGQKSLAYGANIAAAHLDSPRLDLKPRPVYEKNEAVYLKTHYYGDIWKHQWLAVPLALHGVAVRADGSSVEIHIGENDDEPQFIINDLLPHLGKQQSALPLGQAHPSDCLNLMAGSRPAGEQGERFKRRVLRTLYESYGITEEDLISSEIEAVPAGHARDIGLDRSLIAAYGQDDRVCAFAALSAILETQTPEKTAVCVLVDKEEINSDGVSGMKGRAFDRAMKKLCDAQSVELDDCYAASFCVSADVTAAYDPNFAEVYDRYNAAYINRGIALSKYTGRNGKDDASDASAEVVGRFRKLLNDNHVIWQMAELGKIEAGGGGTVAKFMANRDIDTIDAGVAVLSMHAPYETVAKLDCYMTYQAIKALFESN